MRNASNMRIGSVSLGLSFEAYDHLNPIMRITALPPTIRLKDGRAICLTPFLNTLQLNGTTSLHSDGISLTVIPENEKSVKFDLQQILDFANEEAYAATSSPVLSSLPTSATLCASVPKNPRL